jgi:hypothetical protein
MSHAASYPVHCANEQCTEQHPSGKWGTIRADETGWFHALNGEAYCPKHVPLWVPQWRARKRT